jgi:hypothetical protein
MNDACQACVIPEVLVGVHAAVSGERGRDGWAARLVYVSAAVTGTGRARVAGVLALISSVLLTLIVFGFTLLAIAVAADSRRGGYCESIDHPGKCESEALDALAGFSLTGLGLWGAAAGVGLLRGRSWARRATMFVFSAWAFLVTALFAVVAADDGGVPLQRVLAWLLIVGCFVAIAVQAGLLPAGRGHG